MPRHKKKPDIFSRFTSSVSMTLGHAWVFITALVLLFVWAISGPVFGFSDTWQLIINTSTTIVTFLMVFIIQNTQNRDNMAANVKLDAIMNKLRISREEFFEAENHSEQQLKDDKKSVRKKQRRKTR
jgi:low affinity Fe/Cu permease